jgi:hypothetical protein
MAKGFHRIAEEDRRFLDLLLGEIAIRWLIQMPGHCHYCNLCGVLVTSLKPSSRRRRVHLNSVLHTHEEKHVAQFTSATRGAVLATLSLGVKREEIVEQVLGFQSREEFTAYMRSGKVFGETP